MIVAEPVLRASATVRSASAPARARGAPRIESRRRLWLVLGFVLVGVAVPAGGARAAEAAAEYSEEVATQLAAKRPDLALQALVAVEDRYSQDPGFNYLLGSVAMQAQAWGVALNALERLVLQQPNNAGAWLDLAIASYRVGDTPSARQFFDYVEEHFQPPPSVRDVIAGYRRRMTLTETQRGFSAEATVLAGYDTNANSGISTRSLPLTFGEQRIDFDLDPASLPRRDSFFQLEASLRYQLPDARRLRPAALVYAQWRDYRHENDFDTRQVLAGVGLQGATPAGQASGWFYRRESRLGGRDFLTTQLATLGLERPWRDDCRANVGIEVEGRRYATLPSLDADVTWLTASVQCGMNGHGAQGWQWLALARLGNDRARGDRPGGGQSRRELLLAAQRPLPPNLRLEASLHLAFQQDAGGYSPVIENNAARQLTRTHARIVLARPLWPSIEGLVLLELTDQRSNLPLFELRGQMLGVGVRALF